MRTFDLKQKPSNMSKLPCNLVAKREIRILKVNLIKRETTGLGFLLQQRAEVSVFRICELCKNGAAESSKQIQKGDLLLTKVNTCDLTTLTYETGINVFI